MKDELIQLGLREREAIAYLSLYNFEEANATELAKVTREHRTNIYDTLNNLLKKGLISYTVKNGIKYYKVTNPIKLLDLIQEKEEIIKNLIPILKSKLITREDKPLIEIYEGKEGFKSILTLILREKQTIYGIGASEKWEKMFPIKIEQYMKERQKNKIRAKLLYVNGSKPIQNKMNDIKFLPIEFSNPSTIAIFGDYVVILMWTEHMVATVTKSKNLSNSFRKYFQVLWKISRN